MLAGGTRSVGNRHLGVRVHDPQGRTIAEVLREIAVGYVRGTPNGIRMDPASALVWSPSHFTWMDTNHPAGTPREGYPIEIQALWIKLLQQVQKLGVRSPEFSYSSLASSALASLPCQTCSVFNVSGCAATGIFDTDNCCMPVNGGGKDCFTCQRQEYLCGTITQYGAPFNCVDQRVDCSGS